MSQKERISEILVVVGIAAFAWYKYSRLTREEKENVHNDIKEIGGKVVKGFIPDQIKTFLPDYLK